MTHEKRIRELNSQFQTQKRTAKNDLIRKSHKSLYNYHTFEGKIIMPDIKYAKLVFKQFTIMIIIMLSSSSSTLYWGGVIMFNDNIIAGVKRDL